MPMLYFTLLSHSHFCIDAVGLAQWTDSPAKLARRVSIILGYFSCFDLHRFLDTINKGMFALWSILPHLVTLWLW